jgi:hypothetical protein
MTIFVVIVSIGVSVYAEYTEPLPDNTYNLPYMIILNRDSENYLLLYTSMPVVVVSTDYYKDGTGYLQIGITIAGGCAAHLYNYEVSNETWSDLGYSENFRGLYVSEDIMYSNYSLGTATTTFELEENQKSFFGIDFEYSGFFGNLKVQLGKKQESGTYKTIKEWQYPKGTGHVSIPANEIPQGNTGEYIITIYEGDTIINQYPYVLNVEKESYCEINYPVNGQSYNYYPNVNIRYNDMGKLYLYINGEMYKQIQTKDREGIEVIEGKNDLFDLGMNTVMVKDSNGQVVATVQYEVLREGLDPGNELPEFEAESWVQELFDRIMNEYSLFFEYVRGIYGFLPVEIVGLVVIIMMLSVILWFTGRK